MSERLESIERRLSRLEQIVDADIQANQPTLGESDQALVDGLRAEMAVSDEPGT